MRHFDDTTQEFDLREYERQIRRRRLRKVIIALAIVYFIGLFVAALVVSKKEVVLATEVYGHQVLKSNAPAVFKFRAFDLKNVKPIKNFRAKLSLIEPSTKQKWTVLDAHSGDSDVLTEQFIVPKELPVGEYKMEVEISCNIGVDKYQIPVEIRKQWSAVKSMVSEEKPEAWARPKPVPITELGEPAFRFEIIPENGRVAYNLPQKFFFIARTREGVPRTDLRVIIENKVVDKTYKVADFITDDAGMGVFEYKVPLGQNIFDVMLVKLSDKDKKKLLAQKRAYEAKVKRLKKKWTRHKLRRTNKPLKLPKFKWPKPNPKKQQIVVKKFAVGPKGAHAHIYPEKAVVNVKDTEALVYLRTNVPTQPHYVDVYKNGVWLQHWQMKPRKPLSAFKILLFPDSTGIYQVELTSDTLQVGSQYDAFYLYYTKVKDPNRILNAVYKFLDRNKHAFDKDAIEEWSRWVKHVVAEGENYNPEQIVRAGFSMMKKQYFFAPLIYNSKDVKIAALRKEKEEARSLLLWLMGGSGLVVLAIVLLIIVKEFTERRKELKELAENATEEEIEEQQLAYSVAKGRIVSLSVLLVVLIICYILMMWYLVNLDWGSTFMLTQ